MRLVSKILPKCENGLMCLRVKISRAGCKGQAYAAGNGRNHPLCLHLHSGLRRNGEGVDLHIGRSRG